MAAGLEEVDKGKADGPKEASTKEAEAASEHNPKVWTAFAA